MTATAAIIEEPPTVDDTAEDLGSEGHQLRSLGDRRRLTSIWLLRQRAKLLNTRWKARQKHWTEELTESTQALNSLIDEDLPSSKTDLMERLKAIKGAREECKDRKTEKGRDLDGCTSAIKANDAALTETADADLVQSVQQRLAFEDTVALADGLDLTPGTLELIDAAAREVIQATDNASATRLEDVKELATALASLKISGMHLVTPAAEAVESDGDLADHASDGQGADDEADIGF
jgi:hypothetical protein